MKDHDFHEIESQPQLKVKINKEKMRMNGNNFTEGTLKYKIIKE